MKKENLKVNCFHCAAVIKVKYVNRSHDYSQKNEWDYWTEKEENGGLYLCDNCLVKLYKNCKWEFHQLISPKKKILLRQYITNGTVKGRVEREFVVEQKKKKGGGVNF